MRTAAAATALFLVSPATAQETGSGPYTCPPCNSASECIVGSCDTATGTCRFDPILDCEDGNPCTVENDVCCPNPYICGFLGCETYDVEPAGTLCDDGNPCTAVSACDGSGRCVGQPLPAGSACDDSNLCTSGDACTEAGVCAGVPVEAGTPCDDGSLCTSNEVCKAQLDGSVACEGTAKDCDDRNACTLDTCDPATGACGRAPLDCNDRNACTAETCDPERGCVRAPVDVPCGTGAGACSYGHHCEGGNCIAEPGCPSYVCQTGTCDYYSGCTYYSQAGTDCSDACYYSTCIRGYCEPQIPLLECDDGNPLTQDSCHPEKGCVYTDICDDFNPCTSDSRDPVSGACLHAAVPGSCDDRNACTIDDTCVNGACRGTLRSCDDANSCTNDYCDNLRGCFRSARTGACDDGNPCTENDACREGSCSAGVPILCDDGDPGTLDTCNVRDGCVSLPDPRLTDQDGDGVPDSGDNCPTVPNPDQDPAVCEQSVVDIFLGDLRGAGRRAKSVRWRTTHELDVAGFNVLAQDDDGSRRALNRSLIPCQECTTGAGASYVLRLRLRGGEIAVFVEMVHADGSTETFGPAQ